MTHPASTLRRCAWAGAWSLVPTLLLGLVLPWPLALLLGLTLAFTLLNTATHACLTPCYRCGRWVWIHWNQREPRILCNRCYARVGDDLPPEEVGRGKASRMGLFGETLLVFTALMLGLVNEVFDLLRG